MGWLYTFHFSLESRQPIMTLVLSVSALGLGVCSGVCLCVCVFVAGDQG